MGSAQRRRDLRHLVEGFISRWPWSLRSPDTTPEGKSNDSSTRLWEINQMTFQHFTCIHFSSKIDGLSAEDEAVSLLSPCYAAFERLWLTALGIRMGFPRKDSTARSIFKLEISRWSLLVFSFDSPSITSRHLSAQFSSFSYHHLCCLLLALEIPFGDVDIEF